MLVRNPFFSMILFEKILDITALQLNQISVKLPITQMHIISSWITPAIINSSLKRKSKKQSKFLKKALIEM